VAALRRFSAALRCTLHGTLHVALALLATIPVLSGAGLAGAKAQGISARAPAEAWVCTAIPRRFWLPIGVLTERLSEQGYTVLEALETRDDCYALRLRDRQSRETTVIFDPVSAKPLK
jgi:hypothetical protein